MGIKISELTETNQLSDGCCIPVVNNGTTKKIKIKNLKTQLNPYFSIEDGHLFSDGVDIGEVQGSNGKTAYELACEYGFVGTEQDFAKGLNASVESGLVTEEYVKETVNNAVAEIVANAPEDFNTLKEMSDWIAEHEDDATAMNTAIQTNKTNIATEITNRTNADINLQNQINNKADSSQLSNKVDKVSGKGLSTNDYTTTEKNKLAGIATGANKTTVDSALSTSSTNPVQNKVVTSNINTLSSNLNSKASQSSVDTLTSNLNTLANQVGAMNGGYSCAYVCETASATKAKTLDIKGFELLEGACIRVVFKNGNSIANPTLNVNNTGAKEIVVPNGTSVKKLSSEYGTSTLGAYKWVSYTVLELYYNGSYWVALNNPIIAYKRTCTDGTTSNKPAYRCNLDGYKEIYGSNYIGDISKGTEKEITFSLPITMGSSAYNASIALRQNNLAELESGEELSFYGNTTSLTIHLWNRNEGATIKGANLVWIIKGY